MRLAASLVPSLVTGLVTGLLALAPSAQSVFVVAPSAGPGVDFTALQPAIDAALTGDTILVRPGEYAGFKLVGKAVRIVGDGEPRPVIFGPSIQAPAARLEKVPAGELALLQGLAFRYSFADSSTVHDAVVDLFQCDGTVWIEDCEVDGCVFNPGGLQDVALRANEADEVVIVRSSLLGGWGDWYGLKPSEPGLELTRSSVFLFESEVRGGMGDTSVYGAPAASLNFASLYAHGSELGAGNSNHPSTCVTPTAGVVIAGIDSSLTLYDAPITGGVASTIAGCCFACVPVAPVENPDGAAQTVIGGRAPGMTAASPLRVGQAYDLQISGEPGSIVVLLATLDADLGFTPPIAGAVLSLAPTVLVAVGSIPAGGVLSVTAPVAPLSALTSAFGAQALTVTPSGDVQSSTPAQVVVVDASF